MSEPAVIEDFYGVYLLYSLNEKFAGRTYIGFTVNPNRRIKQHNKGIIAGGARKTSNKGPWKMILIVHGFPNSIAALRFEWAWQNPSYSRRLNHIEHKKRMPRKESHLKYCIRILSEMLRVGPWNRLPLVIRWLEEDYVHDFNGLKLPPFHMPICYGKIKSKKICPPSQLASVRDNKNILDDIVHKRSDGNKCLDSDSDDENIISKNNGYCTICTKIIDFPNRKLSCLNTKCNLVSHMNCLAELFLEDGEYIPIQGDCPSCKKKLLWGDLIRQLKGCKDLQDELFSDHSESDATDDEFEVLSDAMSISSLSEKFDGSDSNDE